MKTVRLCAVSLLFYGGLIALAAADPTDDGATSTYEPGTDPNASGHAPKADISPQDRARAQNQAEQNNDWLMRGYVEQAQARALANGGSSSGLYSELSSDKDLAKSLGLATPASTGQDAADLHAGTKAGASPLGLRPDAPIPSTAPAPKNDSSTTGSFVFTPFASPFGSGDVAGLHDIFAKMPRISGSDLALTPAGSDSGALDTPGMVAAESDPAQRATLDLALDPLPGEAAQEEDKAHQGLALVLPTARNAEQIQKQEDVALLAPGKRRTIAPAPINPLLLKPVDDTALMVPDPPPIRGQLGDPYDILR